VHRSCGVCVRIETDWAERAFLVAGGGA
jgi:hypothetical protein